MKKMTVDERLEKMRMLRASGYNCAQSVLMCFPDLTGLDDETAAGISAGMGTGIGGLGEICGAANAMAIIAGTQNGAAPTAKIAAGKDARELCSLFAGNCGGRLVCRELKKTPPVVPCNDLIEMAIRLVSEKYVK